MPKDFLKLCPIEFNFALQDWQKEDREKWERMRIETFLFVNTQIKKPIRKPYDLIPFDWDERPENIVFSDDYVKRIKARDKKVLEILKKQNGKQNIEGTNN